MDNSMASASLMGLVVMAGAIGIPVYVLVFAIAFGGPRVGKVRVIFAATVLALVAAAVVLTWIGGALFSLIVPK